jgi:hypothetical protein
MMYRQPAALPGRESGFDSLWALSLYQDVGKSGIPRSSGARDRWFKSSHPDFDDAVEPVLVRVGGC